ncbi:MAG: virulence RhuM family protein [Methylotenera sp.]|nr:virulence RhuM family protein [Methylotenera sp.]
MNTELVIYQSEDGRIRLETRLENETLWMTQNQMAELFGCSVDNISLHLKNIYEEGELLEIATTEDFSVVRLEGEREVSRNIKHYNLDAIISVGYRVKSVIATRFRIWATQQLKEFIIKGFVMDDERLKNPPIIGAQGSSSVVPDYFSEMLARVRDIRASERRMYLRVREIFALAADYEPTLAETTKFFSVIQNKLHFAATGMTAAELITSRAEYTKPNMGLSTWQKDEVRKTDVVIAKNYLAETEVTELNRIVTMWLDFAEDQATRRKQVFMQDWADKLDDFLRFNDRAVLSNAGRVSKKQADAKATLEYDKFAESKRALKEKQAEADYFNQLADVAKIDKK